MKRKPGQSIGPIEIDGVTRSFQEWCVVNGVNHRTAVSRVHRGWSVEKAITKVVKAVRPSPPTSLYAIDERCKRILKKMTVEERFSESIGSSSTAARSVESSGSPIIPATTWCLWIWWR